MARKTKKVSKKKAAKKKTSKKKASAKKVPAKKAATKTKRVSRRKVKKAVEEPRVNETDIQELREMLLAKWREILGDVNTIEGEALKKSHLDASGDLSSMPIHMADLGTDNYEQEFALGLLDSERKLLKEIADALQRMEDGTYGICEGTGKAIPRARLQANPWARYCVEYARMVEQGLVEEGRSDSSGAEDELEDIEDEEDEIEVDEGDDELEDEDVDEEVSEDDEVVDAEGADEYEQDDEDEEEKY